MTQNGYLDLLKSKKIFGFLVASFVSSCSDNILRCFIIFWGSAKLFDSSSIDSTWALIVSMCFVIPFIILSGFGGYLAGKYPKKKVFVVTRSFELLNLVVVWGAFYYSNIYLGILALIITASISSMLGPAKYSFIPEIVNEEHISEFNGLIEFATNIGIALGVTLGGWLYHLYNTDMLGVYKYFFILGILGLLSSFLLPNLKATNPDKEFNINPFHEVIAGTRYLNKRYFLFLCLLGISFFWFSCGLLSVVMPKYAMEILGLHQGEASAFSLYLTAGVIFGALCAGRWSNNKIELGIVPFSLLWVTLASFILLITSSYLIAIIAAITFGFGFGLYAVPLNSMLQSRSSEKHRSEVMAANNAISLLSACLAFVLFFLFNTKSIMNIDVSRVFIILFVLNLACFLFIVRTIPYIGVRSMLWLVFRLLLKVRYWGEKNVPKSGGVILVANHVSYFDGLITGSAISRSLRYLVWDKLCNAAVIGKFLKALRVIPIGGTSAAAVKKSMEQSSQSIKSGQAVFICPEGGISRTGHIHEFQKGVEKIISDPGVPRDTKLIPVFINYPQKSAMKNAKGKFSWWRFLTMLPIKFDIVFGEPIAIKDIKGLSHIKKLVKALECQHFENKRKDDDTLSYLFIKEMKRRLFKVRMVDHLKTPKGTKLNSLKTLTAALILNKQVRKLCKNEGCIGIIIPPCNAGALINLGISIQGSVPVNINFTTGKEAMDSMVKQCKIKTIFTSKMIWKKLSLAVECEKIFFLEDIMKSVKTLNRLICLLDALLLSPKLLWKKYNSRKINSQTLATVLFSSGTTGDPKGIMLSHHNIISNIEQVQQVLPHNTNFALLSALPYFHSFGLTAGMWLPLLMGLKVIYHPSILDVKGICDLIEQYKIDIIFSVPNFYSMVNRLAEPNQLRSLKFIVSGAAKLDFKIYKAFKENFGLDIFEGYGCTELSPVVSANTPNVKGHSPQKGFVFGSVGRLLPGILHRIVDPDTMQELKKGEEGLLLIKGPNRMMGYLNQPPEKTFIDDGWYNTGDIAKIEAGFLYLTDRLSRFSKIGGEMVPHMKIEEEIKQRLSAIHDCVVTFVVDKNGEEKLVALYTDISLAPEDLHDKLLESSLPRLWIPKTRYLLHCKEIPLLGSGKQDLKGVRNLAKELLGGS